MFPFNKASGTNKEEKDIMVYICYVPVHSAPLALRMRYKSELWSITVDYGQRVLCLPLYADIIV